MDASGKLSHGGQGVLPLCRRVWFEHARASDGESVLREFVTSVFRRHSFPACTSMFPRYLLSGTYAMPTGMTTPDFWVALVGYLRCCVAYFDVASLRRTTHSRQQHRLAQANLWPGLAGEHEVTADVIVHLLAQVVPGERLMIQAMHARWRLMALRRTCWGKGRLECLIGSLRTASVAFVSPVLWATIVSNVLLAISPSLFETIMYGRARWFLTHLRGQEQESR